MNEYFKDYYVNSKYIGSLICEKDREIMGFFGRKKELSNRSILLDNNKIIKYNTETFTELQILCVKK